MLMVTPASLTITAADQSVPFGSALPPLTANYVGFVNGDSAAFLSTPVQLSAPNTQGLPAGSYTIVASGASSPDYVITFVNGTLTVSPISQPATVGTGTQPATSSAQAATSFVTTLYHEILGRAPEPAGLQYWRRRLLGGMSPRNVAHAIERSPEYLAETHSASLRSIPFRVVDQHAQQARQQAIREREATGSHTGLLGLKRPASFR
jgi:hypothetical protein